MEATKIRVNYIDPVYKSCEDDMYEDDAGLHIVLLCQHNETFMENTLVDIRPGGDGQPIEISADVEFCEECEEEVIGE